MTRTVVEILCEAGPGMFLGRDVGDDEPTLVLIRCEDSTIAARLRVKLAAGADVTALVDEARLTRV